MRRLKGISELVKLFNSENQEVQRFATGATRNLIYENMDNKVALIEEGGIPQLVEALKEPDDELRKNITGERRRRAGRWAEEWEWEWLLPLAQEDLTGRVQSSPHGWFGPEGE